ncbi:hypothetical protein GGU11DRAFT_688255, partial [Lentinula aff. detonsa]
VFSGSLKSKTKHDLVDIAFSLSVETDGVSADVLRICLDSHFEANPLLKQNPRYVSLFTHKRKRNNPPNTIPGPSSNRP